jgi:hypothetical protein
MIALSRQTTDHTRSRRQDRSRRRLPGVFCGHSIRLLPPPHDLYRRDWAAHDWNKRKLAGRTRPITEFPGGNGLLTGCGETLKRPHLYNARTIHRVQG